MSKSDLQARPIYHHKRDSIEAHLTIVFAALPVSRWIEAATRWPIRKFVKTARRYRTIQIQAGPQLITAAHPLPTDLRTVHRRPGLFAGVFPRPCRPNPMVTVIAVAARNHRHLVERRAEHGI